MAHSTTGLAEKAKLSKAEILHNAIQRMSRLTSRLSTLRASILGEPEQVSPETDYNTSLAALLVEGPGRIQDELDQQHSMLDEIESILFG